jgi:hypothetical protein
MSIKSKVNGTKITPWVLSFRLVSEFFEQFGDDVLGNKVFRDPQIAMDALKILGGGAKDEDIETIQSKFLQQQNVVSEFKSLYHDPQNKVQRLYEYIKWCDEQFKIGFQGNGTLLTFTFVRATAGGSLGSCGNSRNWFLYCICRTKELKTVAILEEPLKQLIFYVWRSTLVASTRHA